MEWFASATKFADNSRVSPFGEWLLHDVEIVLPAAAAAELFLRGPAEAKEGFNEVVVTVDDEEHVQDVANRTAKIGYDVYSLAGILRTIRLNVRLVTFAMASVAVVALAVAAIGITNTMIMSVLERTHEIGIIKALGARDRDVRRIFLVEGMLVGLIGSALGLVLGWLASYPGDAIARHILSAVNESRAQGHTVHLPRLAADRCARHDLRDHDPGGALSGVPRGEGRSGHVAAA